MANSLPYVRSEFKVKAVIDGIPFDDVIAISATFGLNSIPSATLQVATGIAVQSPQLATIHTAIGQLRPRSKAKVTLTIKTNDGQTDKMLPDGDYVIFEGYYSGMGYQRSHTNATASIHLIHWIDDLNCSSMLNGNWFHGAPHDMAQAASNYSLRTDGTGEAIIAPIVDGQPSIVTKTNMENDLWGSVIKPIFEAVANMPHPKEQNPQANEGGADASGIGGGNNKAALDALTRMPGNAPQPSELKLNLDGLDETMIQYNVNNGISHLLVGGMAYTSFWGKLIGELGASFLFGVSPGVEFANVIPYFGGLSKTWQIIEADEFNYANFNCNVASLIESVDMFYPQQSNSGYDIGGLAPTMNYYTPWGRYPDTNQDFRGHILVRDPPAWLANAAPQSIFTPRTTLPPGGDSLWPQKGPASTPDGAPRPAEAERNVKSSKVVDRICEHWFKSAVLAQRQGELSGKFRLDIAPGSTVKIMAANQSFGGVEAAMYGTVTQVSYVINAEQHVAGTSFTLMNLRNENENKISTLVADKPPLYNRSWPGGPLISVD